MVRITRHPALLLTLVLSCVVAVSAKGDGKGSAKGKGDVSRPPEDLTDAEKTKLETASDYSCYAKCTDANGAKSTCGTDRIDTYLGTCNEFKGSKSDKATTWGAPCPKHVCKDKCTAAGVAGDFHCFTLKTGDEFNLKYDDEKDAADMALALGCPGAHKMGAKWMAGAKHTACHGGGPIHKPKGERQARPSGAGFNKDSYKKKDGKDACKATLERFVCKKMDEDKSQAKCEAQDNCVWADNACKPKTEGSDAVVDDAYKNVLSRAKAKSDACEAITDDAKCVGDCAVVNDGEAAACEIKPEAALAAAGVDGVDGMMFEQLEHETHVCNAGKSKKDKTACDALAKNKGCEWNADELVCTTTMAHRTDMAAKTCPGFHSDYAAAQRGAADKLREKHKTQKKKAEDKRDVLTAKITDVKKKKKAKILADLAIAGKKAKKIKPVIEADSADAACTLALERTGLTTDTAVCEEDTGSRRRHLLASYTVVLIPDPSVDTAVVVANLEGAGYSVTVQEEDPIAVLRTVDGVAAADIDALEVEADAAAELQADVSDLEGESDRAGGMVSPAVAVHAGLLAAVTVAVGSMFLF